jgi:DNA (cytosine-5)-methyltransferase 1
MSAKRRKHGHKGKQTQLRAIDLFSGCGGLTLGLKLAGFRVVGAVESDLLSVETYKRNHRKARVWHTDITQLSVKTIKRELGLKKGELDLLAGCPPCQGFSTLTTKNGKYSVEDPRNSLIYEFLRFVEELRPRAVLVENVPGLAKTLRFRKFCKRLREMGYSVDYRVLNVADYGVPQRRRRLMLLAGRSGPIKFADPDPDRRTVRDAISFLPLTGKSRDPLHNIPENRSERIKRLIRRIPARGGSRTDLGVRHQLACHKKSDGFKDVYGRMAWDEVSPTITSGFVNPSKGRFLHPVKHRTITLREAALLQTFPPSYFISLRRGKFPAAALIGNAIPPEFVKRHGRHLCRYVSS